MELTYRRLTPEDLEPYLELRILQLREEGATETLDLRPALRDYCLRHLADGTFSCWLAETEGRVVGTGAVSLGEKPPWFACPSGRIGLISSLYTDPAFRRQGIAREILTRLAEDARAWGCGVLHITASQAGVPVYREFGFEFNPRFLQYRL